MMASFELAWRGFFDPSSAGQGWCSSSLWLRNPAFGHSFPQHGGVGIAFPKRPPGDAASEGSVSGYVCNHSSLRIGNETLRLLAMLRAFLSVPLEKKEDDVFHRCPFYARRRSLACVIGVHLPMSSALGVFNHASRHRSRWRRSQSDP